MSHGISLLELSSFGWWIGIVGLLLRLCTRVFETLCHPLPPFHSVPQTRTLSMNWFHLGGFRKFGFSLRGSIIRIIVYWGLPIYRNYHLGLLLEGGEDRGQERFENGFICVALKPSWAVLAVSPMSYHRFSCCMETVTMAQD